MKVIVAEADEASLRVQELVVDAHEEDVFAIVQLGDDLVGLVILHAIGVGRARAAREDREQHSFKKEKYGHPPIFKPGGTTFRIARAYSSLLPVRQALSLFPGRTASA